MKRLEQPHGLNFMACACFAPFFFFFFHQAFLSDSACMFYKTCIFLLLCVSDRVVMDFFSQCHTAVATWS